MKSSSLTLTDSDLELKRKWESEETKSYISSSKQSLKRKLNNSLLLFLTTMRKNIPGYQRNIVTPALLFLIRKIAELKPHICTDKLLFLDDNIDCFTANITASNSMINLKIDCLPNNDKVLLSLDDNNVDCFNANTTVSNSMINVEIYCPPLMQLLVAADDDDDNDKVSLFFDNKTTASDLMIKTGIDSPLPIMRLPITDNLTD